MQYKILTIESPINTYSTRWHLLHWIVTFLASAIINYLYESVCVPANYRNISWSTWNLVINLEYTLPQYERCRIDTSLKYFVMSCFLVNRNLMRKYQLLEYCAIIFILRNIKGILVDRLYTFNILQTLIHLIELKRFKAHIKSFISKYLSIESWENNFSSQFKTCLSESITE